jgi:flagella basal body P-ring formation protein FlgA
MRRLLATVILGLMVAAAHAAEATEAGANRLQLRAEAAVSGNTVRVADVLVLSDADPELVRKIGDASVADKPGAPLPTSISHEQVVKRLDELGVNLSRVLVSGALQCKITRQTARAAIPATEDQSALLHPVAASEDGAEKTLADVLRAFASKEIAGLGGTAEVTFERAGQEFLKLTTPPWEFTVSSPGHEKLGLREFHVIIRRDGQMQRKVEVFGEVHLVHSVVVALRPLSIGNFIRPEDVGLETRVFEQGTNLGLGQVEAVIGQQVKRFLPAGELLQADALKPVDMVVRSRPVTISGSGGAVQLRLSGVALDSGGYGDTVRVRLGDTQRDKQVLRGVVTGMGTVRLAEGVQ